MTNPAIILFGATGDLAKKKLIPALLKLYEKKELIDTPIVCVGRRAMTKQHYLEEIGFDTVHFTSSEKPKESYFRCISNLTYCAVNMEEKYPAAFASLMREIDARYHCEGHILCYLALDSSLFVPALDLMQRARVLNKKTNVAFEKPFGRDLASARVLDRALARFLSENQIYRVDHYLGKDLVDTLLTLRFANPLWNAIWNATYLDSMQITLAEDFGIEGRSEYYDKTGAFRDVVQNHLLQLVSLVAMESPQTLDACALRDEKVAILKKLGPVTPSNMVLGQYEGYHQEKGVAPRSRTETFVAFKTTIRTPRWKGVPIYIRTGKALAQRYAEVNLLLKPLKNPLFSYAKAPNIISIRIQPQEGIAVYCYVKQPGTQQDIHPVTLEFCHACEFGPNTAEAYERLLLEMMRGNQTLFARRDEVEESWKFTDAFMKKAATHKIAPYPQGSMGPSAANLLIQRDKHEWVFVERKMTL